MKCKCLVVIILISLNCCVGQISLSHFKGSNNDLPKYSYKKSGYTLITEILYFRDIAATNDILNQSKWSLRVVNGYQFNNLTVGIGAAIEKDALPLSLDLRYAIKDRKGSPTIGLNISDKFLNNDNNEGLRFNPTLGVKSFVSEKTAFLLNFGVCWFGSNSKNYYSNSNSKTDNIFLTLCAGFSF